MVPAHVVCMAITKLSSKLILRLDFALCHGSVLIFLCIIIHVPIPVEHEYIRVNGKRVVAIGVLVQ